MKILDTNLVEKDGCIFGVFWVSDWLKPQDFLGGVCDFLKPYILVSFSWKYTYGFSGKETKIRVLGVKPWFLEVKNENPKTGFSPQF